MTTRVKATKGAKFNINYHLVWCPKFRRPVLTGKVAERMGEMLGEVADKWGFEIIA